MSTVDKYFELARKQPLPLSLDEVGKMIDNFKPSFNGKKLFNLKNIFIMMSSIIAIIATVLIINFNSENVSSAQAGINSAKSNIALISDYADPVIPYENGHIIVLETEEDQTGNNSKEISTKTEIKEVLESKSYSHENGWRFESPRKSKNHKTEDYDIVIEKETQSINSELLSLYNHRGKIEIKTWTEPKAHLKAMIKIKASDKQKKIFSENFEISFDDMGCKLEIINNIVSSYKYSEKLVSGCNTGLLNRNEIEFENGEKCKIDELYIHFIVTVPENFSLDLTNNYDNVTIDDINGSVTVDLHRGDLFAENILKDLKLWLSHGNANITSFKSSYMDIHKSKVDVKKCNDINIDSQHSKFNIENVNEKLRWFSHKDSIILGKIPLLTGTIMHGDIIARQIDTVNIDMHKTTLNANSIAQLNWYCSHSKLLIKNIGTLHVKYSHKDKFEIAKIEKIMGETSHTDITINEITGISNLTTFKGKVNIEKINQDASTLYFDSEHTDYSIAGNNKYNLIIEHFKSEINLNETDGNIDLKEFNDGEVKGQVNNASTENDAPVLKMDCFKGIVNINI